MHSPDREILSRGVKPLTTFYMYGIFCHIIQAKFCMGVCAISAECPLQQVRHWDNAHHHQRSFCSCSGLPTGSAACDKHIHLANASWQAGPSDCAACVEPFQSSLKV